METLSGAVVERVSTALAVFDAFALRHAERPHPPRLYSAIAAMVRTSAMT